MGAVCLQNEIIMSNVAIDYIDQSSHQSRFAQSRQVHSMLDILKVLILFICAHTDTDTYAFDTRLSATITLSTAIPDSPIRS
jgi:hypothetical protein